MPRGSTATKRVGVIVPSVNTVIEDELRTHLPSDVSVSSARVTLGRLGGDPRRELDAFSEAAVEQARNLADASVDVIAIACTAASIVRGQQFDEDLRRDISEDTGSVIITATSAMLDALAALQAQRVLLLTPYEEWLHDLEVRFLEQAGIDVDSARLTCGPAQELGYVDPNRLSDEISSLARSSRRTHGCVVVSCANARLLALLPALERDLGVPLVTSNQALAWGALHAIDRTTDRLPWGRLSSYTSTSTNAREGLGNT